MAIKRLFCAHGFNDRRALLPPPWWVCLVYKIQCDIASTKLVPYVKKGQQFLNLPALWVFWAFCFFLRLLNVPVPRLPLRLVPRRKCEHRQSDRRINWLRQDFFQHWMPKITHRKIKTCPTLSQIQQRKVREGVWLIFLATRGCLPRTFVASLSPVCAYLLFLVHPEFIPESPPLTRSRGMLAYLLFCRGSGALLTSSFEIPCSIFDIHSMSILSKKTSYYNPSSSCFLCVIFMQRFP